MSKRDPRKLPDHRALGRGLEALLPKRDAPAGTPPPPPPETEIGQGSILLASVAQIHPNPSQPRRDFDQQALLELTQSIEREGIIQPIIVRRTSPGEYQIIAGERRWRAA